MRYQAVIFDLDGVICHTDKYHYEAWKELSDSLGIFFDETINNRLRGVSRMESLEIILENYDGIMSEEEKSRNAELKNKIYVQLLSNMSHQDLPSEVNNTLLVLKESGILLGIGSSSKNAKYILKQIGLEGFFDAIADGNSIINSKPDPEVFLKAAEYLQIKPESCLVVEDAMAGIVAAKAAGMDCAAVGEGMLATKADYFLFSFEDLLAYVK